jgi:ribosome-binding protein aMBF1 (putative translation factor)
MTDSRDWIDLLERREHQAEADALVARSSFSPGLAAGSAKDLGSAMDLGPTLAAARRAAGLSRDDLALRLGSDAATLARLESPGAEEHSLPMLRRLADALGMELRIGFAPRG